MTSEVQNVVILPDGPSNERCVQWSFWECQQCSDRGPMFRVDVFKDLNRSNYADYVAKFPGQIMALYWDNNHCDSTGHRRFYRWTLERSNAVVFHV